MSDTIIAALIGLAGVIVTVGITKFEEISALFRKPSKNISGVWEGESYEITYGSETIGTPPIINHTPTILDKYFVTIKQRGEKFEAEMVETAVFKEDLVPRKYKWKGKMIEDYIVYDSACKDPGIFLISTAMLNINKQRTKLEGYFVAASGSKSIPRPWVGFATITRKV